MQPGQDPHSPVPSTAADNLTDLAGNAVLVAAASPKQGRRGAQRRKAVWKACLMTEAKALQPSWARYPGLSVSTPAGADFPTHANLCAPEESRWDSSSPCADDMQTDSPSNIMTPVPEGRYGMEVSFPRLEQYACRAATAPRKGAI